MYALKIKLPNAKYKLQQSFPYDNRGDIKITIGKHKFKLQKAFLRLYSKYFERYFKNYEDTLTITANLDEDAFANIMQCFYGYTITMRRSALLEYYSIAQFLEAGDLIRIIYNDMVTNSNNYDVFILLRVADKFEEQKIFYIGISLLEIYKFDQLNYSKSYLYKCSEQLFKLIIKTHNRHKPPFLGFTRIATIIRDFCDYNNMDKYAFRYLRNDLIPLNMLSSQYYMYIVMLDAKSQTAISMNLGDQRRRAVAASGIQDPKNMLASSTLTESIIYYDDSYSSKEQALEMENTFVRKLNEELKAENAHLLSYLTSINKSTIQNKRNTQMLQYSLNSLKLTLYQREKYDDYKNEQIERMYKLINDMRKYMNEKNYIIKKIEYKIIKLEKSDKSKKYIDYDNSADSSSNSNSNSNTNVKSQYVSAKYTNKLVSNMVKPTNNGLFIKKSVTPQPKEMSVSYDEEYLEEMYKSRLTFDEEPLSIQKKYLPRLAAFLPFDGFQKKKMTLRLRMSQTSAVFGKFTDTLNRNTLLILLKTKYNYQIACYTYARLTKDSKGYMKDENAFISNLNKNERFKIKSTNTDEAIYICENYLICFDNDIRIPLNCLKYPANCEWPSSYESGKGSFEKRNSKWLTGYESNFSITTLYVYEGYDCYMTMDI